MLAVHFDEVGDILIFLFIAAYVRVFLFLVPFTGGQKKLLAVFKLKATMIIVIITSDVFPFQNETPRLAKNVLPNLSKQMSA